MSKKTFMVAIIIASLVFSLASCVQIAKASAKTIIVPDEYTTIQSAIDNANNGDTVFVKKGIYPETLVVYKSISLIGEDRNLTVIDGQKRITPVIVLEADSITFTNFTLGNNGFKADWNGDDDLGGNGIRIFSSGQHFINVVNNTIVGCPYFGIYASDFSENITIIGNTIIGNYSGYPPLRYPNWGLGSGIYVGCTNSLIAYNTLVNTTVGISFRSMKDTSNILIRNQELNMSIILNPFPSMAPTISLSPSPSSTIPEFPSWIILPIIGIATLTALAYVERIKKQK